MQGTLSDTDILRKSLHPLVGSAEDYDPLLEIVSDARFVLLGEASHGTHEFYRERAEITKRLITEKGFRAVAVEADWPDAYRINRFVRGAGNDTESIDALAGFKRFPTWMWRNADVLDFIGWLRAHNDTVPSAAKVGFYGLDLYSLHSSIEAVLLYLSKVDPEAASQASYRYSCFDHYGEDTQRYGYAAGFGLTKSCENEVVTQLLELRRRAAEYAGRDGRVAEDEYFYTEQNARLVKNAEEYYRSMFQDRVSSWNLRDRHMAETLDSLVSYLSRPDRPGKVAVWEHNSHLGDARATQMGDAGELNVGQLVRERYGHAARLIGFSTYEGTVTRTSRPSTSRRLFSGESALSGCGKAGNAGSESFSKLGRLVWGSGSEYIFVFCFIMNLSALRVSCAYIPEGNVSGTSPRSHPALRSSGSTARVRSKCSTASNWSANRA